MYCRCVLSISVALWYMGYVAEGSRGRGGGQRARINPFQHIRTSDEHAMKWSKRYGWHFPEERQGMRQTARQNSMGYTQRYQQERPWKSMGSFTGDLRLQCLTSRNEANCKYGIVEMFHREFDTWGVLCGKQFSKKDASVVCKYLGFSRGVKKKYNVQRENVAFPARSRPSFFEEAKCNGDEYTLTVCPGALLKRNHNCSENTVAAVVCKGEHEHIEPFPCKSGQVKCEGGTRCIERSFICDGMSDCPWGSDETECEANCLRDQYWCGPKGGGCIAEEFVCDGDIDCIDGMDERDCDTFLDSFTAISSRKSHRSNKYYAQQWTHVNPHMCARICLDHPTCYSFDYHESSRCCYLSTANTDTKVRARGWTHYLRRTFSACSSNDFRCENGNCVNQTLVCDGKPDCEGNEDELDCADIEVRLQGGINKTEGSVEVTRGQAYGLICDKYWTMNEAHVVCRQLGHVGALSFHKGGTFGRNAKPYFLERVECRGDETSLNECRLSEWGVSNCTIDHEAGVVCDIGGHEQDDDEPVTSQPSSSFSPRYDNCGNKGEQVEDPSKPMAKIVGGHETYRNEWPWQVAIWLSWTYWCGGTLISECWVLSAAHCFQKYPKSLYTVKVGDYLSDYVDEGEQSFRIANIVTNNYNADSKDNDIALVQLAPKNGRCALFNPAVGIGCLPARRRQFTSNSTCYVTGWGKQSATSSQLYTQRLLKAMIPIIPKPKCEAQSEYRGLLTPNMLCAGFLEGGVDTCQGDSGGPLSCYDRNDGRYYVWGIVSWGNGCARANAPGVYTSVINYVGWINSVTGIHNFP